MTCSLIFVTEDCWFLFLRLFLEKSLGKLVSIIIIIIISSSSSSIITIVISINTIE